VLPSCLSGAYSGDGSYVALVERLGDFEKVAQRASKAIKFPHDEGVAGAQVGECAIHLWPRAQRAAKLVLEDFTAPGSLECVQLEAGRLFVGRDSRVADQAGVRCFRYIDVSRARETRSWGFLRAAFFDRSGTDFRAMKSRFA